MSKYYSAFDKSRTETELDGPVVRRDRQALSRRGLSNRHVRAARHRCGRRGGAKAKMRKGRPPVGPRFLSRGSPIIEFVKSTTAQAAAMITCPKCFALRRVDGLHQQGEPYMQLDERGSFMLCLKCGARVPWEDHEAAPGLDFGDDMAPA